MLSTFSILAISTTHILIVLLIVILLFGARKIPELMRGMGTGIKEFKDAVKEEEKPTYVPPAEPQHPAPKQEANFQSTGQGQERNNL